MAAFQINLVFVYFVYGLAFFGMGLAVLLEIGRARLLEETRVLRPLAVFGLLHGTHEWMEMFMLQSEWNGIPLPEYWQWIKLGLLSFSFVSLLAYGIQILRPPKRLADMDAWVGAGFLTLYCALVLLFISVGWINHQEWVLGADVLSRYVLAIPGSIVTGRALHLQFKQKMALKQVELARSFRWAAWIFIVYALTQLFVAPINLFPSNLINSEMFHSLFGFPIQVIRALVAIGITTSLIRAMQIMERNRQLELTTAQQERYDALEQIQEELVKKETLRRELLRHTVVAQEDERARISRELHDETAQILTAFSLDVATLNSRYCEDPEVEKVTKRLQTLSRTMSQSLNRLVQDLRPAQLDDLGLISAINHLIDENQRVSKLKTEFNCQGNKKRLDPLVETVLYRVVQEALTNIIRHAQVKNANINLIIGEDLTRLQVQDFGVGFDLAERHPTQIGWGIAGMRERVRSVGGEFRLTSTVGKGTIIEVEVPTNET